MTITVHCHGNVRLGALSAFLRGAGVKTLVLDAQPSPLLKPSPEQVVAWTVTQAFRHERAQFLDAMTGSDRHAVVLVEGSPLSPALSTALRATSGTSVWAALLDECLVFMAASPQSRIMLTVGGEPPHPPTMGAVPAWKTIHVDSESKACQAIIAAVQKDPSQC